MRNLTHWFGIEKKADKDYDNWGHGDTLHGQMKQRETKALIEKMIKLKSRASSPSSLGVLPRWSSEVRRKILLLPPVSRIAGLSMYEIDKISSKVKEIEGIIDRYRTSRLLEILNGADNP